MKVRVTLNSVNAQIEKLLLPVVAKRIEKYGILPHIGHKVIVDELKSEKNEPIEAAPFMVMDVIHDVNSIHITLGDPVNIWNLGDQDDLYEEESINTESLEKIFYDNPAQNDNFTIVTESETGTSEANQQ